MTFWWETIRDLRRQLEYIREQRNAAEKECMTYRKAVDAGKKIESDLRAELEKATQELHTYSQTELNKSWLDLEIKHMLAREQNMSHSLAEQNRDLVRQLELYKAVLAQLQIPIKLPGKKQ